MNDNGRGKPKRPLWVNVGGLLLALVLVTAAIVFGRLFGSPQPPQTPKQESPASISREGEVYAGIPGRIEFVTAAAEARKRDLKDVPPSELENGMTDDRKLVGAWEILTTTADVFNAFNPESEVGRMNADKSTAPREVSDWMAEVTGLSTTVSQMTSGAFDITVRPLKLLWKDAARTGVLPTDGAVTDALGKMGWGYVTLLRTGEQKWELARTRPAMELDFGGIVKGWSAGKAMNYLRDMGVRSALVQVGGEIALMGDSPSGRPWRIGIRHPIEKDRNWTVLTISGRTAVSTSGNYEQPIMIQGVEYYHIFDPTTGRPVSTDVLGTTVVATEGDNPNALADGLATAFSVMGPDRALELARKIPGVDVLFIVRDRATGELVELVSPGFDRYRP